MPGDAIIEIKNLSAGYNKKFVFSDITLDIAANQIIGLAGLNGQGKTTFIKTLLGLKKSQSGELVYHGNIKSPFSYLPEKFSPPLELSGLEYLHFVCDLEKQPCCTDHIVQQAMTFQMTQDILAKRMASYSKGMRQKIGVLATFLTGSPIIILDEPMSGLDPLGRSQVKKMILMAKNKGKTILMTSHMLSDIQEICDKFMLLHDKKLAFYGSPHDLMQQSAQDTLEQAFLQMI